MKTASDTRVGASTGASRDASLDNSVSRARPGFNTALRVALIGGACVGTLDLLFARIYWDRPGLTFQRVCQSIAAGLYGKASFDGGLTTAWIGAACHYLMTACMALAYFLVSRRLPALVRYPVSLGLAYGVVLYLFMNFVVLPLSAVGLPSFDNHLWVASSVVVHALFGVICALTTKFLGQAR